ncbi:hypothetical protein TCAL_14971 [Tigriopus californicus]|uniref:PDZ domain-containing protein n=1 Tax=Tigriopus californicus TaxID=6832 RepID=A0A553N8E4_TIGCA|nr:hypothetical protein TCAL_14971 [Tigriopus californicus]
METIKSWKGKVVRSRSPLRGISRSISEYMISTSSAFCLPLPLGQNHRRNRPVEPANSFDLDHYYSDEEYDPTDHGFIALTLPSRKQILPTLEIMEQWWHLYLHRLQHLPYPNSLMVSDSRSPMTMDAGGRGTHLASISRRTQMQCLCVEDIRAKMPLETLVCPYATRLVILCKDEQGKVGLKVKSINKGVFVCLVAKNSPAAMGGLRFGDQVLQINGDNVAGFNENKVHDIFKKAPVNNIVLAVRDRPFERTLTLHKDSTGHLGFQFKDGKITAIAVNSSAARNGLLIDHNLLEVNGQNVVGVKDKETTKLIDEGGQIVTITVIPNFLYQHMVKNMANSLVKKMMDHSMPDI